MTIRLRLLGGASIGRDDGTLLVGRAAQRHRLALLALLACPSGSGLSRDKLLGLLWPESDTERARNLLNVSVYELRRALGEEALLSGGDELRLNPQAVGSDVAEFEAAIERDDREAAVALYRGPLLDGFFVDDAPEFERWADRERARLADAYARALETLAEAAERRRDFRGAVGWWGRRAAHDPYDSRVAMSLMRALDASGHRAGALQHASVHERLLKQELGLQAPSEVAVLAERMRAEALTGISPAAPVSEVVEPAKAAEPPTDELADRLPGPQPASAALQPPSALGGARPRVRAVYLALIGIAVVAGLAWAFWPAAAKQERSVAVLPFVNMSPDGDNDYISDGLTEEIITRLSAIPGLKVISRTSAMLYKGSEKSLRQIADELHVAHVMEGSVRQSDGRVHVSVRLVDARADLHLWADDYEYTLRDISRVHEDITREVATFLEVELGGRERMLLARQGTRDPDAYEFYRRGRFLWSTRTREGHEQAMDYYRRAIERDSSYADAYAGMADIYLTSYQLGLSSIPEAEVYSRLKWAAERALALDDQSADAHTSFAVALWWQRNWPGAERELGRAIELNPSHATARTWYSLLLAGMNRLDEAVNQSRRAAELDPFALIVSLDYAWVCYIARDYDCAIEQFGKTLELNNAWGPAFAGLGLAYAQKRMHEAAIREVSKAAALRPQSSTYLADLSYVHALAGRREEAGQFLRRAKNEASGPFGIARAYVALGEPDSAFAWLERSSWQWPHRAIRAEPALDPLRSDLRFMELSLRVEREMGIR